MIDRTIQPAQHPIEHIEFIAPDQHQINDHAVLYHMKAVPNETARFDLYFDAGKSHGTMSIPSFVNGLLLSGTDTLSSIEISEKINGLGGFMESGVAMENAVISMYCLRENVEELYSIVLDAIKHVAFFEKEVNELISDRRQSLKIAKEKVNTLAQRAFQKGLFASHDNYSQVLEEEDFDAVSIDALKAFHQDHYLQGLTKIVVVGDLPHSTIESLISQAKTLSATTNSEYATGIQNQSGRTTIEKKDALQTAVRVGRMLFNKQHPDYLDFLVLNTILGDYFGSRLMANIREDKGYTYGIGSMIAEFSNTGYFMIATEVGKDVTEATLTEIQHEITTLQNESISEEELELVKSYMLGQLLKSADGPYALTDLFLSAEMQSEDLSIYNKAIQAIREISPERIKELANTYLQWEDMTVVTAG